MRSISVLALAVTVALCVSVPSPGRGDDKDEKKRLDEIEELLRKAEPKEEYEIARKEANDQLIALLGKAESMELLRLDPKGVGDSPEEQKKSFHGYKVVLQPPVEKADQRAALVTSLGRELHWAEEWKAGCFSPRRGLRVVIGKDTLDLVICFQCHRMKVYRGDAFEGETILLGSKWESADKILPDMGKLEGPMKK